MNAAAASSIREPEQKVVLKIGKPVLYCEDGKEPISATILVIFTHLGMPDLTVYMVRPGREGKLVIKGSVPPECRKRPGVPYWRQPRTLEELMG